MMITMLEKLNPREKNFKSYSSGNTMEKMVKKGNYAARKRMNRSGTEPEPLQVEFRRAGSHYSRDRRQIMKEKGRQMKDE